jgi:glycosyltransferase involved in cell wall biosynthesis
MTTPLPRSKAADALVLSAMPLPDGSAGLGCLSDAADIRFATLSTLRRGSLIETLRILRSVRARKIIVTGDVNELTIFGDLLYLLSLCAHADERLVLMPEGSAKLIRYLGIPGSLWRLLVSFAKGFQALLLNRLQAGIIGRPGSTGPLADAEGGRRCLYLRPTLMLGVQVGGSVGHVAGVVNALHRRGNKVRYLGIARHPLIDAGVEQHVVRPAFTGAYPNELNNHLYHRMFFREAWDHAIKFKPAFIYQRYSLNDLTGVRLRRKLGIPLILEFNGSEVWAQKNWGKALRFDGIAEKIEAANLRGADLIVVISEEVRRQVVAAGVPESKVLFYPNCVDPILFDPSRFRTESVRQTKIALGVPAESDLFTFVGTFGQWHGTDILASAIRTLIECEKSWLQNHRIHFLLVGDGPLIERVRDILGRGVSNHFVTLAGFRPQSETPAILAASNVLLSPHVPNADGSRFFGSPTKLFEYMAMGKLIVASDLDQIGVVLRGWAPDNGQLRGGKAAALLVKPGDCESLVSAIRRAGEMDVESRQEFGEIARSLVLRSFTWDKNVSTVLASLQTLSRA